MDLALLAKTTASLRTLSLCKQYLIEIILEYSYDEELNNRSEVTGLRTQHSSG
jgi:hypothetical protein